MTLKYNIDRSWTPPTIWPLWLTGLALLATLSGFDSRRLMLTALLFLIGMWAIARRRELPVSAAGLAALLAIAALGLFSGAQSASLQWSSLEVAYTFMLAVAAIALAHELSRALALTPAAVAHAITISIALCCFSAAVAIYSSPISGMPLQATLLTANFGNIRFFNQYQTWTLPFLAAALIMGSPLAGARDTFWQAFVFTIAAFFWALLWHSGGRGTGYATLIATAFVAVLFGADGRKHAKWMLACAAAGFVVSLAMFSSGSAMSAHMAAIDLNGRAYLWLIAWRHILAAPWFGIGPMQYAAIDTGLASHPHDAILQWTVEWGVPAAVLFVAGILYLGLSWLRVARELVSGEHGALHPALVVATTASLIAGGIHALVSGVIDMPASQFLLVTIAALAGGIALARRSANKPRRGWIANMALLGPMILLASVYISIFTARDYYDRLNEPAPTNFVHSRNTYQPRYWLDGTLTGLVKAPASTNELR
ncbi:O-antigen ligase family protein [Salinisphaera sp.]|uniref:O-antigen ligase family protein n=1 Tax=Salinisphaera sp. TaxID=1914330 RepID=UPI002D7710C0|nr:O-antigen ligase family protein [Salinisphaera sp.]HET7313255.1 O-antigen ligase family protein [Salinisphaera sp.]